ncbi:MAG TPA: ABC transporter ATP-binding protein [Thermoanaerobaculia bacterium]|nr:ABC transporter ATP-binding protein [Thermoanaerobaculia bacterium]
MDVAIRAEELSKVYKLYPRPVDRLLELFTARQRHTEFPALQQLSFEVPTGETIGLVGQNGAGKSTLLKLLCGVAQASSGLLETRGTIASILELGTGFHPDFSGRDNAVLNASILGLSGKEIETKLPRILEFSELGNFIDRPVKTYSSGMYMRLAFSVAVNVDPDILIIDEALAVGDGHFQKKCIDKIREFQERKKTIFFCSHALYFISTLCSRTMWLDQGTLRRIGPAIDVVHEYETFLLKRDKEKHVEADAPRDESPVNIRAIELTDASGRAADVFDTGDEIRVRLRIESKSRSEKIHILAGVLRAADEMQCFAVGTHDDGLPPLEGQHEYDVTVSLQNVLLTRGDYGLVVFVGDESAMHVYDRKDVRPAFSIRGDRYEIGLMKVRHRWEAPAESTTVRRLGPFAK